MKIDPKIAAVHEAARALVKALDAREALEARCRRELPAGTITRAQGRAMLVTVLDQELAAFNALMTAAYDDVVLDLVCKGTVI